MNEFLGKVDNKSMENKDNIDRLNEDLEKAADGKELLYVCNKSYNIGFRDGVASAKQAWSEEDEEMLEYIIGDVNEAKQLYATKEDKDMADKEIAWLKSLRGKFKKED